MRIQLAPDQVGRWRQWMMFLRNRFNVDRDSRAVFSCIEDWMAHFAHGDGGGDSGGVYHV
jgi:hypothetical protein